ncbi:two-component sensor histidine kinase, partial [Streptomyces sp. SID5785]|nr:two-component sensor histidine kinase [Streptomyces sp. SID5785]
QQPLAPRAAQAPVPADPTALPGSGSRVVARGGEYGRGAVSVPRQPGEHGERPGDEGGPMGSHGVAGDEQEQSRTGVGERRGE